MILFWYKQIIAHFQLSTNTHTRQYI